jgi:hypothetical protein
MKKVSALFAVLAMMGLSSMANADVKAPLWDCALSFSAQGGGLQIGIGSFELSGPGQIACVDIAGNTQSIPVQVRVGGAPVSLKIAFGEMTLFGLAKGIGVAGQPSDLIGTYFVAGAQGAVAAGVGAELALHGSQNALTLNLGAQLVSGLGLNVGLDQVEIIDAR